MTDHFVEFSKMEKPKKPRWFFQNPENPHGFSENHKQAKETERRFVKAKSRKAKKQGRKARFFSEEIEKNRENKSVNATVSE